MPCLFPDGGQDGVIVKPQPGRADSFLSDVKLSFPMSGQPTMSWSHSLGPSLVFVPLVISVIFFST